MHSSGEIIPNVDPIEARTQGMVPIPPALLAQLTRASKKQRRAWFRSQVAMNRAMQTDERRLARNKRKAAAQRRRAR